MKHRGIQVPNKEDDGSQPSDVLDSDVEDANVTSKNISLIEVQFGTQSVHVLNYLRKILLCAEDQTVEFIRKWLDGSKLAHGTRLTEVNVTELVNTS